jgi:hypothetical protein
VAIIINKDKNRLTEAQQKEIVERCNESYDKGGADLLRILVDTTNKLAKDMPSFQEHAAFTLYVIEAVRGALKETVDKQIHDEIKEPNKLVN